eukprot:GILI01032053.1.p1 GENE.GILI01032053.1~~GILI01032053.1.p1  ORF type:complete len:287 (+),score=55.01 GILI01032053.1:107-967(+)
MRSFQRRLLCLSAIQRRCFEFDNTLTTTTTEAAVGDNDSGKASQVLSSPPKTNNESKNKPLFSSQLAEATDKKDDRLYQSAESSDAAGSSDQHQKLEWENNLESLRKIRTAEKPFGRRLEESITQILTETSEASSTLTAANLDMSAIKVAAAVVNLKSTLQSNFPITLDHPISAHQVNHIASVLAGVHLTALRPMHSFTLINQREQIMKAFSLLRAEEHDTTSSTGPEEIRRQQSSLNIRFSVTVVTAIVDEEFSLTTCKVHCERDESGMTLLWLTLLHKMDLSVS